MNRCMKNRFLFILLLPLLSSNLKAAQADTILIFSPAMGKNIPCMVITPSTYSVLAKPYAVLYLLHGYSGNFNGWLDDAPQLREHADRYNILIVCPDGGFDSWYLDSPVDSNIRYETHITKELVAYIDYYYNTRRERSGRAIAGLSMGGHGALYLAIRRPELFGAAGSMCGGLDLSAWRENDWQLDKILGNPDTHWPNWEANSVVNLIKDLNKTDIKLIIDCGLGDFFLPANRLAHQRLLENKVPHEYTERPGEHNVLYWGNAIDHQLVFFDRFFRTGK